MMIGGVLLWGLTRAGEQASPVPWNEHGIYDRYNRLQNNFIARVLDLSTWSGVAGGIAILPFWSAGPGFLGVCQTITLGASVGSLVGATGVAATQSHQEKHASDT